MIATKFVADRTPEDIISEMQEDAPILAAEIADGTFCARDWTIKSDNVTCIWAEPVVVDGIVSQTQVLLASDCWSIRSDGEMQFEETITRIINVSVPEGSKLISCLADSSGLDMVEA